ncbi:MAG: 50S ribosomal protein L18 [Thermodesulfobacteriota bacterium]
MARTNKKATARAKRIQRIRKKIFGTPERPRLRVFKSAKHIYAQVIDDQTGHTLCSMSTCDKSYADPAEGKGKTANAHQVGVMLAAKMKEQGLTKVVFDRGGYIYHGRVKALSDGARAGGLEF